MFRLASRHFGVPFIAVCALLSPALAAAQSRAEDPNYEPDTPAEPAAPVAAPYDSSGTPRGPHESPTAPQNDEPYLEGDAIRQQVGDIVFEPWPPPWRVSFAFVGVYPFQPIGLGIGVDGYVAQFLRLSAFASMGFTFGGTPTDPEGVFSVYGEAAVGVRILALDGVIGAVVEPPPAAKGRHDEQTSHEPLFKAWYPGTHALLVEGGVLTGTLPRALCIENCSDDDITQRKYSPLNQQLVYLETGLRYVFFSRASSVRQPTANRRWQIEAFAHLVFRPLNATSEPAVATDGSRMQKSPLGGRAGFSIPICGNHCISVNAMGGYLPSPDTVTFSLGVGY
jgi:hypothetical protein